MARAAVLKAVLSGAVIAEFQNQGSESKKDSWYQVTSRETW